MAKVEKKQVKRVVKAVSHGHAYIQASFNNTIVSLTDQQGNVLSWASSGMVGFKGAKKATPYAAQQVVKKALETIKDVGLREVNVFIKGVGGGRESAIRALNMNGLNVLSITDVTPIPHNGCRPPGARRV
jgi:small subunit ribosomal protein S11